MTSLKDKILEKIESRELSMKPRYLFGLRLALMVLVALLVLVFSVFIFNFIFFSIRVSGHMALLSFGLRGVGAFVLNFPWGLLIIDVLLVVLLEKMLRHFRFAYRSPVLYLFFAILALAISAGLVIDRSSDVNDRMLHRVESGERGLPFFAPIYRGARRPWPEGFPTTTDDLRARSMR